jgi:hypothetical protein
MDNENVIDLGKWTVPTKWEDVTLEMFQKIEKYYSDKDKDFDVREVLDIFTDHTRDEIDQLPINFTDKLLNELSFLKEQPKYGDASPKIEIDGEEYCINVMEKLKTGEYVAIDTILKSDPHDYISILAVLCRKNGEIYDSKFEAEVFEERQKLFAKQPIMKIMPLISFFLSLYIVRMTHSQLYSEVEEGLNLIQQNIDNSENLGVFKRRSLNSQTRKLRKLLKSNKSI